MRKTMLFSITTWKKNFTQIHLIIQIWSETDEFIKNFFAETNHSALRAITTQIDSDSAIPITFDNSSSLFTPLLIFKPNDHRLVGTFQLFSLLRGTFLFLPFASCWFRLSIILWKLYFYFSQLAIVGSQNSQVSPEDWWLSGVILIELLIERPNDSTVVGGWQKGEKHKKRRGDHKIAEMWNWRLSTEQICRYWFVRFARFVT